MQYAIAIACNFLTVLGFDGNMLQAHLKKKQNVQNAKVMVPHSQECLDALAKDTTHGTHFAATGGHHFTLDDAFCAAEIERATQKIWKMKRRNIVQVMLLHKR